MTVPTLSTPTETLILRPAYRCTLHMTRQEATVLWIAGKDFRMLNGNYRGAYCSKRDLDAMKKEGVKFVQIHYGTSDYFTMPV